MGVDLFPARDFTLPGVLCDSGASWLLNFGVPLRNPTVTRMWGGLPRSYRPRKLAARRANELEALVVRACVRACRHVVQKTRLRLRFVL